MIALLAFACLQSPTTAFVDVDVLTMVEDDALESHTVLVQDGRIVAVGPSTSLTVPEDATVIDGTGCTLLPGLADMHVHNWTESEHLLFVANGVTTVRNMFGSPDQLAWRDEIAAGERFGPTIYTAGPIVDGSPPVWPGSRVVTSFEEGVEAVHEQAAAGYDFIKVYERLSQDAYDGIVVAAEELGIPVMGHVPSAVGLEVVLLSGQVTIEHLDKYDELLRGESRPSLGRMSMENWAGVDLALAPEVAQRTREAGLWNCPTLVVLQKMLTGDALQAEFERPEIRYVPDDIVSMWRSMSADREGSRSRRRRARRTGWRSRGRCTRPGRASSWAPTRATRS